MARKWYLWTQCENREMFLSLRFYVKLILSTKLSIQVSKFRTLISRKIWVTEKSYYSTLCSSTSIFFFFFPKFASEKWCLTKCTKFCQTNKIHIETSIYSLQMHQFFFSFFYLFFFRYVVFSGVALPNVEVSGLATELLKSMAKVWLLCLTKKLSIYWPPL